MEELNKKLAGLVNLFSEISRAYPGTKELADRAIREITATFQTADAIGSQTPECWAIDCDKPRMFNGSPFIGFLLLEGLTDKEARIVHHNLSDAFAMYARATAEERGVKKEDVFVGSVPSLVKIVRKDGTTLIERH